VGLTCVASSLNYVCVVEYKNNNAFCDVFVLFCCVLSESEAGEYTHEAVPLKSVSRMLRIYFIRKR